MVAKYSEKYEWLQNHERKVVDPIFDTKTSLELTNMSKELYSKLSIGANLYSQSFKVLHLATQKKMHYSLESIMQATFYCGVTLMLQLVLGIIMILQQANPDNPDI